MAIFVVGMHRSGTSMVASILQSLGVNLGPDEEMVPANQFNEAGYFENAPTVAINDAFLKKNDLSWRTLPAIEARTSLSGVDEYVQSIEAVVKNLDAGRPWSLKDPRLSFLLPYWKTAAKPVSAIICLRRPDAAALSLKMRNELSVSYAAALWELYTLAALRNTRRMTRTVMVYEELLAKPKQTIEKLIAAIPELAELNPDASMIKVAAERVRRDLDHSKPVSNKMMPPAVLDLYQRLAAGDLGLTKDDAEHGVASELVRLEAGHQAAKRLNNEAREQLARAHAELASQQAAFARHAERLGDIVGLVSEPGEKAPADPEGLLDRLRQVVRDVPGPGLKAHADEAARELLRAKDERIEWLRLELGATGVRAQTIMDQATALEVEVVRLRAEHEQQGLITASNHREIMRLAGEVQRLNELLAKAEEDRGRLQLERARVKAEYEITLAQLTAERGIVGETMDSLRTRLEEKEALIAQIQSERLEVEATASSLRRIAGEREMLLADLSRATEALDQRNRELAELAARERELAQRAYQLDGEIERLQRDLLNSRIREADLSSTLAARDQSEGILRAAVAQQNAITSEIQLQLSAARETIESLEKALARHTEHVEELEVQHAANRRLLAEYEVRVPMLEAASVERTQMAARIAELQAALDRQVEALNRQLAELNAAARRAVRERDQALAAVAERDSAIRERDTVLLTLQKAAFERDEAHKILSEKDATIASLSQAAAERDAALAALRERDSTIEALKKTAAERIEAASKDLLQKEAAIENLKKTAEERDEVARKAIREQAAEIDKLKAAADTREESIRDTLRQQESTIEGLRKAVSEAELSAAQRIAGQDRAGVLEQTVADLNQQLAELTADFAASHAESATALRQAAELRAALEAANTQVELASARASEAEARLAEADDDREALTSERLDEARREAADLREQLAAAMAQLNQATGESHRLKTEHDELTAALLSARNRAEQLRSELSEKSATPQDAKTAPSTDQRLRRQLLVLNELLQAIDTLLSPKYGRFAIPVRQIRVRLIQARQVVDGEVAMTRR